MAKYLLSEASAAWLRSQMALKAPGAAKGSSRSGVPSFTEEDNFAHPFEVRWATSLASGEGESATDGEWIIWLPGESQVFVVDTAVDLSEDLDEAGGGYPEGWYKLGDLLDPDAGGSLYLAIDTESKTAELSDEETSGICVKVCEASVDDDSGARSVVPMITSALVVGSGSGGGDVQYYFADEWSVSQMDAGGSRTNFFLLKGFGRFAATEAHGQELGNFQPSSELALDEDEASSVAFLVRAGNSDTVDLNQLGYRTLKIKSPSVSSPFKYTKTTTTDPQTHQPVTTHKLVNCNFYWNGVLKSLQDFDVSGILAAGSVYLRGTQAAPSAQTPDPEWTWTLGTAVETAPSGGKVLNYKMYDFAQGKPSVDYRTTFLSLEDHTQKAKMTVGKPNAAAKVEIDASGEKPKLVVTDGNGHSISLDLSQVDDDCAGVFGLHSISYKDENGETQVYHGIFCDDIDLTEIKAAQTQADWQEGNSAKDSFIKNKVAFDAITGLSFAVSEGKLKATMTKKNTVSGAVSTSTVDLLTLVDTTVVKSSAYTDQQKLVNTLTKISVLAEATPSPSTADVFETTPHSLEA